MVKGNTQMLVSIPTPTFDKIPSKQIHQSNIHTKTIIKDMVKKILLLSQ